MYSPNPQHITVNRTIGQPPQPNVIVVEDVNLSANLAKSLLRRSGYTAVVANTGREALDLYQEYYQSVKLVLMDINLPDMDGCDVTGGIREYEREHGLPQAIIYALTGDGGDENHDRYRECGMNGCIVKGSLFRDTLEYLIQQSERDPKKFVTTY